MNLGLSIVGNFSLLKGVRKRSYDFLAHHSNMKVCPKFSGLSR